MLSAVGGRNEPPAGQPHHGSPTVRPAAAPAKEAAAVVPIMAGKGEGRVAGASYHVRGVPAASRRWGARYMYNAFRDLCTDSKSVGLEVGRSRSVEFG